MFQKVMDLKPFPLPPRRRPGYIRKMRFLSLFLQGGGWAAMSIDQIYTFVNISLSFGFYPPKNSLSNILSYSSFNSTANFQLYRKFVIF